MTLKSDVRGEVTTKLRQHVNNSIVETKILKMCLTAATFILLLFGLQFTADQLPMQQRCSFWGHNLSLAPVSLCPCLLLGKHFKNISKT